MANQIIGRVIAVSNVETIKTSKGEMGKRKLFMDCTRYDPYTGERGFENTPLLEFGGKVLDKLNALVDAGLKKDDVVKVTFDVQGTKYTNEKTGKTDVFTGIRPYDIELYASQGQQQAPQPQPQAPIEQPKAPQGQQQASDDNGLPF